MNGHASDAVSSWRRLARPIHTTAVGASLIGKSAELLTLLALITLVPRVFGPADYGLFALSLSIVAIASSTAALGGPVLLSRYLPAAPPDERGGLAVALALRLGRVRALQVGVFAAIAAALAVLAPGRFPPGPTLLVGLALALDVAATLAFQLALGLGATRAWSFRFPVQNAVLLVAALSLHAVGGVTGAIAALPLSSGVALLFGAVLLVGRLGGARRRVPIPAGALRFGVVQALSGFFVQVCHRGGVVAVLLLGGTDTQAGFAALASGIALAASYAVWQLFAVELPRLSAAAAHDPAGVERAARQLTRKAEFVVIPVAVAAALVVDRLLPHLVGEGYRGAASALAPALAALPLAPLTALVGQVAALRLQAEARARATGAGALAFSLAAVVAVPAWGAAGATAAFFAGAAATAASGPLVLPGAVRLPDVGLAGASAALVLVLGLFA